MHLANCRSLTSPTDSSDEAIVSVTGPTRASCVRGRKALLVSSEETPQARNPWSAGVPSPAYCTRGRVRDLTGSLAIHPMPLPCSKTPAEPTGSRLSDLVDAALGQPRPKASTGT